MLQEILDQSALTVDIGITCGHRGEMEQNQAYQGGASKIPWPMSKHNRQPAEAADIYPHPWDAKNLNRFALLAGCAAEMPGVGAVQSDTANQEGYHSSKYGGAAFPISAWQTLAVVPMASEVVLPDPRDPTGKTPLATFRTWGQVTTIDGAGYKSVRVVADALNPIGLVGVTGYFLTKTAKAGYEAAGDTFNTNGGDVTQVSNSGAGSAAATKTITSESFNVPAAEE